MVNKYFRGFAERFRENQEGLFDDTNDFILQSLRNQKEMILEDVLRIIEEASTAANTNTKQHGMILLKQDMMT